jgi:hypothetical protein
MFYIPRQEGFSEPPTSQILFLHPSVALAYRDSEDDKLQEALGLDLIGFYRWRWGGKNEAGVTKPFGLTLTMAWDGEDLSYGVSVHLPKNWSVGVVTNGNGNVSALLSMDLGNYLLDKKKSVDKLRQKFISHQ